MVIALKIRNAQWMIVDVFFFSTLFQLASAIVINGTSAHDFLVSFSTS